MPNVAIMQLWQYHLSYLGIGAMLCAGVITLLRLIKPFYQSLCASLRFLKTSNHTAVILRTEKDIPFPYVIFAIIALLVISMGFLNTVLHTMVLGLNFSTTVTVLLISIIYLLVIGFIFSAITGYFSGLVGVSASPGSAIMIAATLFAAFLLRGLLLNETTQQMNTIFIEAAAFVIMVASIVMAAAAIANDNIQDLKVGHLVGATPWKQQLMLLLGVVIAALIMPPVMELLFNVYGIADVLPQAHMDPTQTLAAPPAALMAAITQGVFKHNLPWPMLGFGIVLALIAWVIQGMLGKKKQAFSVIAFAVGIYLPLTSTTPLFLGALFSYVIQRKLISKETKESSQQQAMLLASGLVAGAALMDVILAIPLALTNNPNLLRLAGVSWEPYSIVLSVIALGGLGRWAWQRLLY